VEELVWFGNKLEETAARQLLEICRIDHLLAQKTNYLSGGEKQRIALYLLLMQHPKLLVLDEPFSNLDPIHTGILKEVLDGITERLKITCTLTSHDPQDTLSWADEIIVMKNGKIIQQGAPQDLYQKPLNEYVAGLFGKYNLLPAHIAALFGIHSNGNTLMTRPENFRIYKTGSGVNGTVHAVHFCGGYNEVEVLVGGTKIITRSENHECKAQDKVFIELR
jgi:iron(III) transport system ATP-binding protein